MLTQLSAACALPYIGIVRGLWEGNCLTEHRCLLARPLGMPSGHIAHASLRGDACIHYYLVMDFTDNNNQTISNRSVIWVHGTHHSSLTWEKFVCSTMEVKLRLLMVLGIV